MRGYLEILRLPGALRFSAAGLLARSGQAMLGLGLVLMVSGLYDNNYRMAGMLTAVWAVSWAIGTAVLSNLVDRYGQRRVMYPAAMVSASSLLVVVGFAMLQWPVWALVVPSMVAGITGGSPGALVRARWKHLLSDSGSLHTAFSLESTLDEITYMVGPILATALAVGVHPSAGLVAAAASSMLGAVLFYGQRATEPPVQPQAGTERHGPGQVLRRPGVAGVIVVNLLIGAMFGGIDVTVVAATTEWDQRPAAGLVLGMFSLASAGAGLLYGARAWGSALWLRFAVLVVAMFGASAALIAADSVITLALLGMLFGITVAPTLINGNSLIGRLVPEAQLTEGLAWMGTGIGIGAATGSGLCGVAIDLAGYHESFMVVAAFGLVALVLAFASLPALRAFSARTKPAPDIA